ncbi:MAG: glycosyltransferase family 39 protein [Candidatus Zixiibacteriota bacterium]|nr:MAG: glycosyltransferase family 39 protein [candidate division Zixibacteria bacterium]
MKFNHILLILLVLCVIVRLAFVFGSEQIPVMWDARIFVSAAIGLINYLDEGGEFGHPEPDSRENVISLRKQTDEYMKRYISGEQVDWLYYPPFTMRECQENLFWSGPLVTAGLAAVFFLSPVSDFIVVRTINALLGGLCLLLLVLIARSLFGRATSVLAGIMYIFYLPFIILTGMISAEPLTSLLTLLSFYIIVRWYSDKKNKYLHLWGISLGLLTFVKSTAILLFVPFLVGLLYDCRREFQGFLLSAAKTVIPLALVTLPWVVVTSLYYGQVAARDPIHSSANIRVASSIKYSGYNLDRADEDFWTSPILHTIRENPLDYARLLGRKVNRLWSQPYNDYAQSFITGERTARFYHLFIIFTALFGVFSFAGNSRRGLIYLFLIPLYYAIVHAVFLSLSRYNLNAMPLMMIASSAAIVKVAGYAREKLSERHAIRSVSGWLPFLGGWAFIIFVSERTSVAVFGAKAGVILLVALKILILAALAFYLFRIPAGRVTRRAALTICLAPALVVVLALTVRAYSPVYWAEWKCRLDGPMKAAGNRIYFPPGFRAEPDDEIKVAIDLVTDREARPFSVLLNDELGLFDKGEFPMSHYFYRKKSYQVFQHYYDLSREEMRVWSILLINPEKFNQLLDEWGYLEITVSPNDSMLPADDYVELFGDYPTTGGNEALIPSFTHSSTDRFVEKRDPRMWMRYKISSDSVFSYYIQNLRQGQSRFDDLSPSLGRQRGRYRIYVVVKRVDETMLYF